MVVAIMIAVAIGMAVAQGPPAGGGQGGPGAGPGGGGRGPGGGGGGQGRGQRTVLTVTSNAFPSGGEVPMKFAGARGGENRSPDFTFNWVQGANPAQPPANLQSYAIVFHDMENPGPRGGTSDTLHWTVFNIPGSAKGLPEGLPAGDQPDGTRQGPGIRGGSYFGPGAPAGPFHHYVWEFYALDAKLDLPATATREQLMMAMEGHVIGKAAYVGRFRSPPAK
jgi:Raf kinase inhibitor-like YbhB/YbcL family protein